MWSRRAGSQREDMHSPHPELCQGLSILFRAQNLYDFTIGFAKATSDLMSENRARGLASYTIRSDHHISFQLLAFENDPGLATAAVFGIMHQLLGVFHRYTSPLCLVD
ncbi:hypothetical protein N7468_010425 [Penicillium chermesinum]|uniref:Uncharacterized protein n=1 Tax=Penicillium chermesinum TaxID=63820 RepID=A0A9W9NCN9_9EURO|nr:uncharacterized protein N7468_010425 [Penicillium chermesinum]KAJ5217417.1 hypothetical protein N7468_010425 [Penicillium chermesinum]